MKFKRFFSVIITLAMVIGMLPISVKAETECVVTDNCIDITDKAVYERSGLGSAKVTDIRITAADVESATEDGTTVYIVLTPDTAYDATINIEFGTALDRNMNMSGHTATVTLSEGSATLDMTLKGQYSSMSSLSKTLTYSLFFSVAEPILTPPVRIMEEDFKTTYSGVGIELNLKDYFENGKEYYLVEGEEKVLLDGNRYTFKTFEGGTHILVFAASNDNGECPDTVTVNVEVTEIQSGAWLGITTSNGSVNYVHFTDSEGEEIDGLTAALEDKNIAVTLPRSFDINGKITAAFDLTQNGGLPKLSTSNAFNGSNDTKKYNSTLSNGSAKATMYLYNANPKATSNVYTTYTITYAVENEKPFMVSAQSTPETAEITAGSAYTLNLGELFSDPDGAPLTYSVKINGETAVEAQTNYSFVPTLGGTYELEFFASDFMYTSDEGYKVIVTVTNSEKKRDVTVLLPDYTAPTFYITSGYDENGEEQIGEILTATAGEKYDGYTAYVVAVPENVSMVSVRDSLYGGMAINVTDTDAVKLCRVKAEIVDFSDNEIQGDIVVSYDGCKATGVNSNFLLAEGKEYIFTAYPKDSSAYNQPSKSIVLSETDNNIKLKASYKNPKTIITTAGAEAKLFKFANNYHIHTVYEPSATVDNGDGTATHYFLAEGNLSYRVSMDGKITKAGYLLSSNSARVVYAEADPQPTDRVDYASAGSDASNVADDSLLININQQNHLKLTQGQTKTLKAYRAWEIINNHLNHIIQPDFNFNIISGEDVVTLTPYENQPMTNSSGNWRKLTAVGKGSAVIEVTYDAIEISGGSYSGFYGATDEARTGLFVVTVDEETADVDFGIKCRTGEGSIVYKPENSKPWDAEFDTLYFIGDSGQISLSPKTDDGIITEVAVSADKGKSFTVIEGNDGEYISPIVSGNNIIRVTTDKGVAYQIVRGDKASLWVKNVTNPGKAIAKGDTIKLKLIGVHTPVPKISGTFNPGYTSNTDGESKVHLHYTFDGTEVLSEGKQYDFSLNGTTMELTIPSESEETEFSLTDGYIGVGVIGVTGFGDDGNSHRNIPDSGGGTRENKTTFTTRSVLPDITVSIGMLPSGNTAPLIRESAPATATVKLGGTYALSMSRVFNDREGDSLTYQAKNEAGQYSAIDEYFTFTPDAIGTYTLEFIANDGELESDVHTIILTVKEKESSSSSASAPEYDISSDKIDGYVNISFTDNGKRVEGEGNITYPKALGTIISTKKVPFSKGDTVADVTIRLLDALDFTYEHTGTTKKGFYLASIGNFNLRGVEYDSFGEFDAGVGSGWMITLNKKFIEYGASDFEVKNGDVIKWQYTCQLGDDIGDPFYSDLKGDDSKKEENKKSEPKQEAEKKTEPEPMKPVFTASTFTDIKQDDWYYEAVKYVYENNLMQGTGDLFEPGGEMTRAMLVTVLYRIAGSQEQGEHHSFTDVAEGEWYTDAVKWAYSNAITEGVSENEFAPHKNVTREQIALIMYRFARAQGIELTKASTLEGFSDLSSISNWAVDALSWANKINLITGTSATTLSPKETANRAQVATILMRFCENVLK